MIKKINRQYYKPKYNKQKIVINFNNKRPMGHITRLRNYFLEINKPEQNQHNG